MEDRLTIAFGTWVNRSFVPDLHAYCDILLHRIAPVFDDVEGEQQRAAEAFMSAAAAWYEDDQSSAADAAYEHAQEVALQLIGMRAVFLATGVSGLFHLFEKQLYRHINKELQDWLDTPITHWGDLAKLLPAFDRKWGQDPPCQNLINAFHDNDLQELNLVANVIKHGDNGPSYKRLVKSGARVVDKSRIDNLSAGPYSFLKASVSVCKDDVERYRDAVLRFWKPDGTYWALRSKFR